MFYFRFKSNYKMFIVYLPSVMPCASAVSENEFVGIIEKKNWRCAKLRKIFETYFHLIYWNYFTDWFFVTFFIATKKSPAWQLASILHERLVFRVAAKTYHGPSTCKYLKTFTGKVPSLMHTTHNFQISAS